MRLPSGSRRERPSGRLVYEERQHIRHGYSRLDHPGIADQLRPFIIDATKNPIVRRVAIDIAEACQTHALEPELVRLALDAGEHAGTREHAVVALGRMGSAESLRSLRSLVAVGDGKVEDDLRGCALNALWPAHMSVQELFAALRAPRRQGHFGMYRLFLMNLPKNLGADDIPHALAWMAECFSSLDDDRLLKELLERAETEVLNERVQLSYAQLLARAVAKHWDEPRKHWKEAAFARTPEVRHTVLRHVLDAVVGTRELHTYADLLVDDDWTWLRSLLDQTLPTDLRSGLVRLFGATFYRHPQDQIDALITLALRHSDLAAELTIYTAPVDLASDRAAEMRKRARELAELLTPRVRERPLVTPPPHERIQALLQRAEAGDLDAWWLANREFTLEADSTHYKHDIWVRIVLEPGWVGADEEMHRRLLAAAKQYLQGRSAESEEWLGKGVIHFPAMAGYRALRLIAEVEPDALTSLSRETWRSWAAIVAAVRDVTTRSDETDNELLKVAYANAPEEVLRTLAVILEADDRKHKRVHYSQTLDVIWDDGVATMVLALLRRGRLRSPQSRADLVRALLEHNAPGALDYAARVLLQTCLEAGVGASRLRRPPSQRRRHASSWRAGARLSRELAVLVCEALLLADPRRGWPLVWRVVRRDELFGRQVFLRFSRHHDLRRSPASFVSAIGEAASGELYVWLRRLFPKEGDPRIARAHAVSDREAVGDFRDRLVSGLRDQKTLAARDELRSLAKRTGDKWILVHAVDCEAMTLAATWTPPPVVAVLRLAGDRRLRVVLSAEQLLGAVRASLARLNESLQGEVAEAQFLWNTVPGDLRPKDEESLSEYVAAHLERDLRGKGVIVNREVQIRRRRGDRPGERTDIHVDAVEPGAVDGERFRVILEVKGSWNDELESAIDTQLVDRYLAQNQCRHGVYVVGWYASSGWNPTDGRKVATENRDFAATTTHLQNRARARSTGGCHVDAVFLDVRM